MHLKLSGVDGHSLEQIRAEVERGARFIVYTYVLLIWVRISKSHFIGPLDSPQQMGWKYSLLSLLSVFWGIGGMQRVYRAFKVNMAGGTDLTGEILLALDAESLGNGAVEITQSYTVFESVGKNNRKEMKKALTWLCDLEFEVSRLYAGFYIEEEAPYFVIGVDASGDIQEFVAAADRELRKVYWASVRIDFMPIRAGESLSDRLVEQGDLLYERGGS